MDNAVMSERSITLSLKSALFLCTFLFCPFCLCNGQQECDQGTFGASCQQTCHCLSRRCNNLTGVCTGSPQGCSRGWTGTNCQACVAGRFGTNCQQTCNCRSGECNIDTGYCTGAPTGCTDGWRGSSCHQDCAQGTFGASCLHTCHCQSGQCDKFTGECTGSPRGCSRGWTGTNCQECFAGKFGTNCQQTCNCRSRECNIDTGYCTGTPTGCTDGWRGRTCQLECGAGTFGSNCDNTCHCQSGECDKITGICTGRTTDCTSGWRGSSCHQVCGERTFGANCDNTCHCQSGECDKFRGTCTGRIRGCMSGWRGISCHQVCGERTFGTNCGNICHCQSGECDRFTGICTGSTTDCMSGWRGSNCHQECGARTFGSNCLETCHCLSGQCHSDSGECTGIPTGCSSGWRGSNCQEAILTSDPEEVTKGSSSITISWPAWDGDTNARDPPVIGYIPYHKNTSATEWIPGSSDPVQTLYFTFSDLTPDTNYSFSVSVVRERGREVPKSSELVVKTTCAVPSSPTNLKLETFEGEKDRFTISWQMPSSQDIRCSSGVTQMTLYFSNNMERGSEMSEVIIDVSNTSYTFNVALKEEYTFQLSMTTAGGESSKSQPIYYSITDMKLEFDISSDLVESKASISTVYAVLVAGAILILLVGFLIGSLVGRRCSNTAPFPQALNTTEDISAKDDPEYTLSTEETKDDISHEYQDLSFKLDVSAKVIAKKQSEEGPSHTYQEITLKSDEPDDLIPTELSRDKLYHEYQDVESSNVQNEKAMLESHVKAKSLLGEVEQDYESYEVPFALKKCTELFLNVPKGTKSKPIAQIKI